MCKYIILFSIAFASLSGNAQSDSLYFSVSSYHMNNKLHRVDTIVIKNTKQHLDVYFFKEHFYQFYGLPKQLVKKKYKNQEIVEWSNPESDVSNWSDSYIYDAKGRLIEYKYSGCMICSQVPWGYRLIYNQNDNIIEQRTYYLTLVNVKALSRTQEEERTNLKLTQQPKNHTKLTYDVHGNIIMLKKYNSNGIEKEIRQLL